MSRTQDRMNTKAPLRKRVQQATKSAIRKAKRGHRQ